MKMTKWRAFYLVLPIMMIVTAALGIIFPLLSRTPEKQTPSVRQIEYSKAATDTGAAGADKSKKGGAIFLEPNTTYTMTGGTISGSKSTYGGAVFISSGATFTMTGGTITGCQATYGGAIYIASGGICYINGGKITGNTAGVAPAIYVEEGGKLFLLNSPEIADNTVGKFYGVGPEVVLGATVGSTKLKTIKFGSYPQTYAGVDMNITLDNWYSSKSPASVKTYAFGSYTWEAYLYTDGNVYVRGNVHMTPGGVYRDGTSAGDGEYNWFIVEPITWYILNFDKWNAGEEDMELFSMAILAANIYFNASDEEGNLWETSYIRSWCNSTFMNDAFDEFEKEMIKNTTVGNNVEDDYDKETSDKTGKATTDKIYLKSYYEMSISPFTSKDLRLASGSDFAMANHLNCEDGASIVNEWVISSYRLRSAGSSSSGTCSGVVTTTGSINARGGVSKKQNYGVRPALRIEL